METLNGYLIHGFVTLPWWGYLLYVLVTTQITIASVTLYLHRHQAHRAIDLSPLVSCFFRLWLWCMTGMITKEWVAVHRKHHAMCETDEDPHSPAVYGIGAVLLKGVLLYQRAAVLPSTMRYVHKNGRLTPGLPDDWLERNLFTPHNWAGVATMFALHIAILGPVMGGVIALVNALWIPIWAAGVINGIGHWFGYRNADTRDVSTNIVPWGIWIGGEELHNNHHAYPTSAKFSLKPWEFDIGWCYIRILEFCGFATVKHLAPQYASPKVMPDRATLALLSYDYGYVPRLLRSALDREVRLELRSGIAGTVRDELERVRAKLKEWDWQKSDIVALALEARKRLPASSSVSAIGDFAAILADLRRKDAPLTKGREQELLARLEAWIARMSIEGGAKRLIRFIERGRLYRPDLA